MSSKLFPTLATIAIALAGAVATSAMAVEGEQWNPEAGQRARADVQAETKAPAAGTRAVQYGEATAFVDAPSTGLPQTPVLAFAATGSAPSTRVVHLGEATIFIDAPGNRTREDVRNETLAALRRQ